MRLSLPAGRLVRLQGIEHFITLSLNNQDATCFSGCVLVLLRLRWCLFWIETKSSITPSRSQLSYKRYVSQTTVKLCIIKIVAKAIESHFLDGVGYLIIYYGLSILCFGPPTVKPRVIHYLPNILKQKAVDETAFRVDCSYF